MEPNGDLYTCDHYVYPEHKVGNIHHDNLEGIIYGEKQQEFGYNKIESLTRECQTCEYVFACYGECPKNRFIKNKNGEAIKTTCVLAGRNTLPISTSAWQESRALWLSGEVWSLQR
ncbi:putative arylsulfatase regulatory protein [Vibrio ishigakensis]|uniref:Putative arylsulfatase regulatory protein n=1 Tax=Vibrio ishigakensis TaxID=1481914 RepID=A0A0B8P354_9VIBR|nr:putative arylsulfatase regulatory protein [Vibrio ishigakensis]